VVKGKPRQRIWIVDWTQVRRHSRTLYVPLDRTVTDIYNIRKGDLLKIVLLEIVKQPRDEEETEEAEED